MFNKKKFSNIIVFSCVYFLMNGSAISLESSMEQPITQVVNSLSKSSFKCSPFHKFNRCNP